MERLDEPFFSDKKQRNISLGVLGRFIFVIIIILIASTSSGK